MKASVLTLVTMLGLGGGHWLLWLCCLPLLWASSGSGEGLQHVFWFQAFALTPPVTLGGLAFRAEELIHTHGDWNPFEHFAFAVVGMFIWTVVSFVLWGVVSNRLRHVTMRTRVMEHEAWIPPLRRLSKTDRDGMEGDILTVEEVREEKGN